MAGPLTRGDQFVNCRLAIDAGNHLRRAGFVPFIPHLFAQWHMIHPRDYQDWLDLGLAWLETCHAIVRLPGLSVGADVEEARANALGLPVFHSVHDLTIYVRGKQ